MTEGAPKHVIIGITGGIAAYKTMTLIRLFKSAGCEVKVVATTNALEFVTPLTIETLSQNALYCDTFKRSEQFDVHHISHADWADCMIVAPASADIIGKMANGIADDALSTLLLAIKKPLFIAPAMNNKMYANEAVQRNLATLQQQGCHIIGPAEGFLACGTTGKGRMEEPEKIFDEVMRYFSKDLPLKGKRALVTAGPTYEPIDPVRFIGNHSSGKMGFALAEVLADKGAEVTLVTGPTVLTTQQSHIHRVDVTTAAQMYEACLKYSADADIIIMSAAVADYTPAAPAPEKIKKNDSSLQLELVKTTDILASLGKNKREGQYIVGFALETENELANAQTKLHNKNLDFIVLNSTKTPKSGFNYDTNQVTIIDRDGKITPFDLQDKHKVAQNIVDHLIAKF